MTIASHKQIRENMTQLGGRALPLVDQVPAQGEFYDLVVVIVNWNARDLLTKCLASLTAAAEGLSVRTVVVDNASTDGSSQMVEAMFPELEIERNQENVGFARANNQTLLRYRERAKYALLLNPDTTISPGAFRKIIDFMDEHPDAGIVGCKVVTPQGELDWACKRGYLRPSMLFYKALRLDKMFPRSPRFGGYNLTYLDEDQIHEVDSVVGAFMMIRRECLTATGLLDESYFMYGEDIDLCYRAKALGWKVFYVPTATIVHHKGHSTGKRSYRMIGYWYDSAWKLYRKQIALHYPGVVNALVWTGFRVMCAASLVMNFFRSEKRVPSRR
jgi:hypothetical protein